MKTYAEFPWCLYGLLSLSLVLYSSNALAQDDAIDLKRNENYSARLRSLQEARVKLRSRASVLWEQSPYLKEEFTRALQQVVASAGALQSVPEVSAIPHLMQTYGGVMRDRSDCAVRQPQYVLWYAFQDNSVLRNQLMVRLAGSQSIAADKLAKFQSTLAALLQVNAGADANFLEFRHAADLMGRRSPLEIASAKAATEAWLVDEPVHAGAALIDAYALRTEGRFDECNRALDKFDSNFGLMKVIHETVKAEIEFVGGDLKKAQSRLAPLTNLAPAQAAGEPYLIRGWLYLANGEFDEAKSQAAKLRVIDGRNIEAVIVEGLATAMSSPRKAKDGLKILRSGQLFSSPEDWHYHEALAIVHAIVGDESFARREIALALQSAPSHIRPDLEEERKVIDAGRLPTMNWNARLVKLWGGN